MSTVTPNLGLFKYDTTNVTDLASAFNINTALNNNWDKIDEAISNSGGARNIGEIVASTIPLTDAGLHLLDGALISGLGSYSEFVQYIANLYTNNPTANYFTDETTWQDTVNNYGVCGKFVYDSVNNTVRLPKITGKVDGTTDINALGDLEPLFIRLPNIIGAFNPGNHDPQTSGAFYSTWNGSREYSSEWQGHRVTLDASRSSSVYSGNGSDTTIHEQAINVLLYIVIATSTKTDIDVDIDNVVSDLNGKADTDLTNITDTGYVKMAGASMPSNRYIDLTLGASGMKYTAPTNGYFVLYKIASGTNQYIQMCNVGYNNESATNMVIRSVGNNDYIGCTMPCAKGQQTTVNYTLGGDTVYFRFCYAVGSESEAS